MKCEDVECSKNAVARGLCSTHWARWRRSAGNEFASRYGDPVKNFWSKVEVRGDDECWPWKANIEPSGYGTYQTTYEGVRFTKAHRFAYHVSVGPVREGLDLDHTCHTNDESCALGNKCPHRACCNPAHLEPVTERVNVRRSRGTSGTNARKTHCIHGHELSGDNLAIRSDGGRRCRRCKRASENRRYARRASAASQSPEGKSP